MGTLEGGLPPEPTLVCPDEIGARALSSALQSMYNYTPILIPRPIITAFTKGKLTCEDVLSEPKYTTAGWFNQLNELSKSSSQRRLILLDEFNVTGKTLKGLRSLVACFNLNLFCSFTLVDFT